MSERLRGSVGTDLPGQGGSRVGKRGAVRGMLDEV